MIGLYLYTLIIGHKFCAMFGIRNALTLHKELQNFMKNTSATTKQPKKQTKKILARPGNRTRDILHRGLGIPVGHQVN